ncbi:MAG TPA: TetR family transcriptional regulator [Solirubrobacteraceae bacterium]|jgi:AcrR family transcriptional regulator
MAEVAAERGAGAASVAHIVARAGVSRRTFYDLFEDRQDCFLAAFDEAIAQAAQTVLPAYEAEVKWRERIRAGLLALLVFFEEEPSLARLCVVEALAAGPNALKRRAEVLDRLLWAVDQGRAERPARVPDPPPLAAEGAVGAVLSVIHRRLAADGGEPGGGEPLTGLLGELMSAIVLPYLGASSAQKELRRAAPQIKKIKPSPHGDPLEGLDMRITYRTVRVLIVIGSGPGASNREIATEAGIADQGQVSKLLTRLESLGLVRNDGSGHAKGAPNAWALTPRGLDVERAIRVQTASGHALPTTY